MFVGVSAVCYALKVQLKWNIKQRVINHYVPSMSHYLSYLYQKMYQSQTCLSNYC